MPQRMVHNILNQTRMMNCGKTATCIAYRASHDIDIKFEDGVVVEHKTTQAFLNGCIRHPTLSRTYSRILKSSCLNQTIMQNCGMKATCIVYRNARDIDVLFEDGAILEHRSKGSFLKGNILNPNLKRRNTPTKEKASCLGLELMMNNGMKAKCVAYRGWADIDVQFEDGTLVERRKKSDFLNGIIESPNWWQKSFPQRIVYESILKFFPDAKFNYRPSFLKNEDSGLNFELDIWIPSISCGIEYDGFPWHSKETYYSKRKEELISKSDSISKVYALIEKGCIEHKTSKHTNILLGGSNISSNYKKLEEGINSLLSLLNIKEHISLDDEILNKIREKCNNQNIGMEVMQKCGMKATCIAYREHNDIDVQFEDGTVVKHRAKNNFLKGFIKNPVLYRNTQEKNTIGKTILMTNGLKATCIAYRKGTDIDVQFEGGIIVEHVQKQHFIRGNVRHPNINPNSVRASCVGLTLRMKNGMNATCIAYRNERDVDVRFEDGTIVFNKRKGNFVRGEVDNPSYDRHSCLGETIKQTCGLSATCIVYRAWDDIDVQFEDGAIVKHKNKQAFIRGNVGHPTINSKSATASCLGVSKRMNNGMMATCVAFRNSSDIDIEFEDGFVVKHRRKERFLRGAIAHKTFND